MEARIVDRLTCRHHNMFLFIDSDVIDSDLGLLVELLEVVDRQIARIEDEVSRSPDPDGYGLLDRMEAVIGLGFVACQQYINATYPQLGLNKLQAVQHPPLLPTGRPAIELINATANFWKHHEEWTRPNNRDEERTRSVIDDATPSTADYVMGNVLYELVKPHRLRFASVVDLLKRWRDLMIAATA